MRIRISLLITLIIFVFSFQSFSQEKFWFFFNDKIGEYEDLNEYTDLPLNHKYIEEFEKIALVRVQSRWLNAVSAEVSSQEKNQLLDLDFITKVVPVVSYSVNSCDQEDSSFSISYSDNRLHQQTESMQGSLFSEAGIDGSGVRIAVFDGGFPGVDKLDAFKKIRSEGRIIKTYDFVKRDTFVYDYNSHGTTVLSCIAGVYEDQNVGLGTGAEFLLARTEVKPEVFSEEENWVEAMEWAYENNANIISSSLGYTSKRYFQKEMDGKTTLVSKMANIAMSKGILVINAIGNDGDDFWKVAGAPADAENVLSIGGINSKKWLKSKFSSIGPTADGRLKPNLVAFSDVSAIDEKGKKGVHYGTSFSAPLVSGFAACVMQMHPEWDTKRVFDELQKSGSLYPYYDYSHGYGIPQARSFFTDKHPVSATFTVNEVFGFLKIELDKDEDAAEYSEKENQEEAIEDDKMDDEVIIKADIKNGIPEVSVEQETMSPGNFAKKYLYYHFADEKTGLIRIYRVLDVQDTDAVEIDLNEVLDNEIIRIHYKGYTQSFKP